MPDNTWSCRQSDLIEVRRAYNRGKGGRGVFALRDILVGTVIERTPVLLIPEEQVFSDDPAILKASARISWYVFDWKGNTKRKYGALVLGFGSLYNHAEEPNAICDAEPPDTMVFTAVKNIAAGQEIFISYRGIIHPRDLDLGFEVKS